MSQDLLGTASASPQRVWGDAWLEHHSPCRPLDTQGRCGTHAGLWVPDYVDHEAALAGPCVQHPAWRRISLAVQKKRRSQNE